MRRAALVPLIASSALGSSLARPAAAECRPTSPCVDADPMWLSPAATRLNFVSDTDAPSVGKLALGTTLAFRLRPAVLNVPAPNENGRDVNLISHALAWSLGARWGIGNRMELTALAAGLSQRGAGIKGVTSQSAPEIASPVMQDPRVGFGFALLPPASPLGAKLRFEAKLPLGNAEALAGEESFVASPSFVGSAQVGGAFANIELGARLRRPTEFFGIRVGSQAVVALGVGYDVRRIRLAFTLEEYILPSLVRSGSVRYLPAEWLLSSRWAPRFFGDFSVGTGFGGALPTPWGDDGGHGSFGAPRFRGLVFVRLTPHSD